MTQRGELTVKDLPERKSIRLKDYNYSQAGYYFITICVNDRKNLLGDIIDGQLSLSEYGKIVILEIENISTVRRECIIQKYVVMPNHIHMIVQIVGDDGNRPAEMYEHQQNQRADCHLPLRGSISNMVRGLKGAVTRRLGFSMWQRSFHDHIIRDEAEYHLIWCYIDENPQRWNEDCYYTK